MNLPLLLYLVRQIQANSAAPNSYFCLLSSTRPLVSIWASVFCAEARKLPQDKKPKLTWNSPHALTNLMSEKFYSCLWWEGTTVTNCSVTAQSRSLSATFGCYCFTMQTLGVRRLALAFGCVVYMQQMYNMGKVKGGRKHLCSWEWGEVEHQMREYRKKLIIFVCGHHLFFPFLYIKYCLLHRIQLGSLLISLLFYNNCIRIFFPISWFGLIFWYLHWHLRFFIILALNLWPGYPKFSCTVKLKPPFNPP